MFFGSYGGDSCVGFGSGVVYGGRAHNGGRGTFHSYGLWRVFEFAVHPIISLRSEVSVKDLQVISGEEQDWSTSIEYNEIESEQLNDSKGEVKIHIQEK